MKLMQKRICAFLLAAVMLMGVVPAFSVYAEDAAEKTEETAKTESSEKVVFDWNCDIIDFDTVKPSGNNYPAYYFADFTTKGVEKGTVHMGGDGSEKHYASLIINHESTKAAVTLDVDMKIKSLTTPAATVMQRGFVIEWELPNNKLIYLVLQNLGEEDENGKNATLRVSKMDRSAENGYEERIYIPTDDEFHKWTFQYDGESLLRISIDGEILKDFHDVNVFHSNEPGRLMFKNIILDMAPESDLNDVTFDNVKITEGTTLAYSEITKAIVAADATAEKFTVTAGVNRLEEDGELTVTIFPRGEEEKAVSTTVKLTELTADVTLEELPFDGMCTVAIDYSGAQTYSFNYYVYKSMEKIEAKAEIEAEEAGELYVFSDLSSVKLPEDSSWYTVDWETAADKGIAVCTPAVADVTSLTVPVKLTGKYAVFAGYVEGSSGIAVNGTNAALGKAGPMGYYIYDAFVTAVDLDGEEITLSNMPFAAAQIAYLKFVSLSDELYDVATREDDSHTFITDNDGFSTLCGTTHGNYETLFKDDFMTPYEKIDQRQFIWCTFSTSMLNYDSEVWWEYVTKRLKELNIPEDKWPKDFLDHVDTEGKHLTFDDIMRTADVNAFNNMRSLNETGYPHAVLADMVKENIEDGEIYISLRMSHYNGGTFAFQTGAYFYLHPEWKRGGGNQLSYMYEDYRNYLHDILIEMAQPENVDGILMDFGRYYYIFGDELPIDGKTEDGKTRTDIMNDFVKSVRDDMPEGKKLTVRVLNPTDEKAFAWGLDYKHWVEEGWVDRVYISDQSHETFFDFDEYIAYFEEHPEVEFYLGVNATLSGHDMTRAEEDILKAGGTIQKGESVDKMDIMLRIYDFYAAGADGVFTFNWSGTDAMFQNVQNATRMIKWYNFTYPTTLMQPQKATITDKGGERIVFNYTCEGLDGSTLKATGSKYPEYYVADHAIDENVPEGQLYIGGEAKESQGYASLLVSTTGAGASYTLSMDMKIESLMKPAKTPTWRGLIFELVTPDAPLLYFSLVGMDKDSAGNNAEIHLSTKTRAGDNVIEKIKVPTDDKFHTWTIDFDGKGGVIFKLDGKEILKADGIVAESTKVNVSQLEIKNVMMDIASGHNSVYIDSISMNSNVAPSVRPDPEEEAAAAAAAAAPKATATVDRRAEVLTLPVSDADWAKATTIENAEKPANYKNHGKEAEISYTYNAEKKQLEMTVNYNLNSWVYDLVIVDQDGKKVEYKTDREFGKATTGYTLWGHSYADSGHPAAVKQITFVIDNVEKMPEKYVLFASNCGTGTVYTAKITIEFPKGEK